MSNFARLFRADIVSASFNETIITQATNGRTDVIRAALEAQFGFTAPAKKAAFVAHATQALTAALAGDTLGVRSYKARAALCAALSMVAGALDGVALSDDAELGRFTKAFAPAPRAEKAKPSTSTEASTSTSTEASTEASTGTSTEASTGTSTEASTNGINVADALEIVLAAIAAGTLTDRQLARIQSAMVVEPAPF